MTRAEDALIDARDAVEQLGDGELIPDRAAVERAQILSVYAAAAALQGIEETLDRVLRVLEAHR